MEMTDNDDIDKHDVDTNQSSESQQSENSTLKQTVEGDVQETSTENSACDCAEENLTKKIADLQKENAELKDQYLRKCADFDNYRKRMIREKQEAFDFANTNLLTDLIAILDDFDRALAAGMASDGSKATDLAPVVDGISMINKQLRNMLESKYNLTAYGVMGDPFNHDLHEAIGSNQAPVAEPVCAQVYLKGYKLKERVIRPAKVMVNMPDGSVSAETDSSSKKE